LLDEEAGLSVRAPPILAIAGFGLAGGFTGYCDEDSAGADQVSDHQRAAPVTTTVDGARVADDSYGARADVYLAGSPGEHAAAPAAGDYYFAVTDPSGTRVLSSDDVSCRRIRISGNGVIAEVHRDASGCAHAQGVDLHRAERGAITVQLMPFDVSPNDEYAVWVIPVADYDGSFVHTGAMHDKFKVKPAPPQVCGNGTVEAVEAGEQCDDGNTADGDGCSASCTIETAPSRECGNGIIEPGEQCDDGNTTNGDGCSSKCKPEILPLDCYDRIVDEETCDDGDPVSGGACAICRLDGAVKHRTR
jgi:cysteine-rich repeat protein